MLIADGDEERVIIKMIVRYSTHSTHSTTFQTDFSRNKTKSDRTMHDRTLSNNNQSSAECLSSPSSRTNIRLKPVCDYTGRNSIQTAYETKQIDVEEYSTITS